MGTLDSQEFKRLRVACTGTHGGNRCLVLELDPSSDLDPENIKDVMGACCFFGSEEVACFLAGAVGKRCDNKMVELENMFRGASQTSWVSKACEYVLKRVVAFEKSGILPDSFKWSRNICSLLNWGYVHFYLCSYGMFGAANGAGHGMSAEGRLYMEELFPSMPRDRLMQVLCTKDHFLRSPHCNSNIR